MTTASAILATTLTLFQVAGDTKRFSNAETGMMFDYPAAWVAVTSKTNTKFTIQLPESKKTAILEVFAIAFKLPADRWQELQSQVNKDLKREIVRQWQEEVLGVPMLMTQVQFATEGQAFSSMTALFYSATPKKLNFRLTAPAASYDEALQSFRGVLQSFRTISGDAAVVEDPNAAPPPKGTKPNLPSEPPKPPKVLPSDPEKRFKRGETLVGAKAAGRDLTLFVPRGWTAESADGSISLSRNQLLGNLTVGVYSVLDSPVPERKLLIESGKSLQDFSKIERREDSSPKRNAAGAVVLSALRVGVDSQGKELVVWYATGVSGDYYWLLTYRTTDKKSYAKDRGIIQDLINELSVTETK